MFNKLKATVGTWKKYLHRAFKSNSNEGDNNYKLWLQISVRVIRIINWEYAKKNYNILN